MDRAVIGVFTGMPGTGKSTLAELTANAIGAPAFAGDWLLGVMKPAGAALAQLDLPVRFDICYSLLLSLITRQCLLGQSALFDCLVPGEVLSLWESLAGEHDIAFRVIECVCSDEKVHRDRVEGRVRDIPVGVRSDGST